MASDAAPGSAAAGLMRGGVAVQDGFICEARVGELIRCAGRRRDRGDFAAARIGGGHQSQLRGDIRGDRTCWIAAPSFAEERALMRDLERLRLDLNREGYLGLLDLELHYAWYAPGTGYARHVDQPQRRNERKVSLVLYLNEAWTPGAGGELRIFDGEEARDIEPIGGRLVCFLTEGREHAVLTTHRDRLSITGWFRQRS
ncbi:MAG TPA: 2OG-Fe(II) oxygenase [Steroidobacteraceae bacterium]|nr:2OG-Fe(II) oxygenase [Steroidobacteraceae bacterium]